MPPNIHQAVSMAISKWISIFTCSHGTQVSFHRLGVESSGTPKRLSLTLVACTLTRMSRYGVRMSARPAATLHAPTPTFRIEVGYSSAVYTGIIVLPALIVNFPAGNRGYCSCSGRFWGQQQQQQQHALCIRTDHDKCDFEPHHIRLTFDECGTEAGQTSTKERGAEKPLLSDPPNNKNGNRNCRHLHEPSQSL